MSKHADSGQGDRHPPPDRVFVDSATRLAFAYVAGDVGKWYTDDDTGEVFELTNSYLPSFRQIGASGSAVYDYPFTVHTVDLLDPSADYDNIAAAIAASVAGDVIAVGPGSYTCDSQTLPANVDMIGHGVGITILSTTGVTALTIGNGCIVQDLLVESNNAAGNSSPVIITGSDVTLINVRGNANDIGEAGSADGISLVESGDVDLIDCMAVVIAGDTVAGLRIDCSSNPTVRIFGGLYDGSYNGGSDIVVSNNETIVLAMPILVGDTIVNSVSTTGVYTTGIAVTYVNGSDRVFIDASNLGLAQGVDIYAFSNDGTFAGNSGQVVPTEQAIGSFVRSDRIDARQGGSSTDWGVSGTTKYTPTDGIMQVGQINEPNSGALSSGSVNVTFPNAFGNVPLIVGLVPENQVNIKGITDSAVTAFGFTIDWISDVVPAAFDISWVAIGPAS